MEWTAERTDSLRRLWSEGLSASEIARTLGGISRNAAIGKVHRLGLMGRGASTKPAKPRPPRPQKVFQKPKFKAMPMCKAPPPPVPSLDIPFTELAYGQCKAITDGTRFAQRCCGHETTLRGVYCAYHEALHSVPAKQRGRGA